MQCSLDIEELNGRAGYRPGAGYVHPGEAADEILDEALQLFLDDLQRRARLGATPAAVELAANILRGLYRCRDGDPESLLEYSPDWSCTEVATREVYRLPDPSHPAAVGAPGATSTCRRVQEVQPGAEPGRGGGLGRQAGGGRTGRAQRRAPFTRLAMPSDEEHHEHRDRDAT